jgi:hypothetical protein
MNRIKAFPFYVRVKLPIKTTSNYPHLIELRLLKES